MPLTTCKVCPLILFRIIYQWKLHVLEREWLQGNLRFKRAESCRCQIPLVQMQMDGQGQEHLAMTLHFKSNLWFTPWALGLPGHIRSLGMSASAGLQGWCGAVNTARLIRKAEAPHFVVDQTLLFSPRNPGEVLQSAVFSVEWLSALALWPGWRDGCTVSSKDRELREERKWAD